MSRYKLPYTIYKRGKYWYYRTYTAEGKRTTPKSTGCKTKGAAVEYCENLLINGSLSDSNISFYQYAHNFFNDDGFYILDRLEPLSDNTIINHRSRYKCIIEPFFKDYKLKDINYIELKKFRAYLISKNQKAGTINTYLTTLKIILEAAYKQDLISKNPFDKLESLGKSTESDREAFTLDQVREMYTKIDTKYKNLVLILALTGMRINEALGVTPADIFITDNNTNYIKLIKQINNKKEYKKIKTKKVRDIPIIPELIDKVYNLDFTYKTVYKYFRALIIELYGNDVNLCIHSFRHFFCTNTKSKNINPDKVKIIAGHVLEGSEDAYTNFTADDLIDILHWQQETLRLITE